MSNREKKMEHRQEKESQAGHDTRDGSSQVETEDTAQARAEAQMYGEEPGLDYWKELAEKRREALETALQENEELHTTLYMVEEEKGLAERERDNLREEAEQAQELAKIVKSLVTGENERVGQSGHGPGAGEGRAAGARTRGRRDSGARDADRRDTGPSRACRQDGGKVTQGKRAPRARRDTGAGAGGGRGGGAGDGRREPPRS